MADEIAFTDSIKALDYADANNLAYAWEGTAAFDKRKRLLTPDQYVIRRVKTRRGVRDILLSSKEIPQTHKSHTKRVRSQQMFDIHFLCDDKRLSQILKLLDGLAYELEAKPVKGAQFANGKVRAAHGTREVVIAKLSKLKNGTILTSKQIKDIALAEGVSPGGINNYPHCIMKARVLRKAGTNKYRVTVKS
jgi:hypothetical protein